MRRLKKLPEFVKRRRHNFKRLYEALLGVRDKLILPAACEDGEPSWFGFLMTCRDGVERGKVVRDIEEHGVQTRMLFAGNLTRHPCFDQMRRSGTGYRISGGLKNTDRIMEDSFWVGVYPGMTDEMVDDMAEIIIKAADK